jgi:hypothetical protein
MVRFLALAALGIVVGCASQSPTSVQTSDRSQAKRATLVSSEAEVANCTFVSDVTVEPPMALLNQSYPELAFMAREDLRKDLRRQAGDEGGDAVLPMGLENGKMHGKAYDCDA